MTTRPPYMAMAMANCEGVDAGVTQNNRADGNIIKPFDKRKIIAHIDRCKATHPWNDGKARIPWNSSPTKIIRNCSTTFRA